MKETLVGIALMGVMLPLALLGLLLLAFFGLIGRPERARAGVRALDHFVNAAVFNGYSWESISSHAWRVREEKAWARGVIHITNWFQQDHCMRANRREQRIIDLVLKRKLHHQTIGRASALDVVAGMEKEARQPPKKSPSSAPPAPSPKAPE
ncbi:MAG: hypothetical protein PHX60_04150 [Giesbergeria sp.]|uniref:hypothetical protein n=1 Tax=Giesbergeria sp. TaxID=2818473 RepID=UPI0026176CD0|nr:hypothetical protein [Giesbergeria sp.]MDD2608872.1 hypothetical protein [Giesbergeria sp.]